MTKPSNRSYMLALISIAAMVLIIVGCIGLWNTSQPTSVAHDMNGRSVTLDPGEVPVPAASSEAVPDTGTRLVVPSVGLDVPLGALNAVDGQITPPGFTSAYIVRNMGVGLAQGTHGTVFIVMHSLRNGAVGPGNYITDVDDQRSKLTNGAQVEAGGYNYTVTGSQLVSKQDIANDAAVWTNTPNRLLLITCLEHADGSPSTQNLVITAVRTGP